MTGDLGVYRGSRHAIVIEPATAAEARDDDDAETGDEDGSVPLMRTVEDRDDGLVTVSQITDKGN